MLGIDSLSCSLVHSTVLAKHLVQRRVAEWKGREDDEACLHLHGSHGTQGVRCRNNEHQMGCNLYNIAGMLL